MEITQKGRDKILAGSVLWIPVPMVGGEGCIEIRKVGFVVMGSTGVVKGYDLYFNERVETHAS